MNEIDQRKFVNVFEKEVPRDGIVGFLFRPTTTYMNMIIVMVFSIALTLLVLFNLFPELKPSLYFVLSIFAPLFGLVVMRGFTIIGEIRDAKIMAKVSKEKYFEKLLQKYGLSYTGLNEKEILQSIEMFFTNGREGHFFSER